MFSFEAETDNIFVFVFEISEGIENQVNLLGHNGKDF